MWWYFLFDKTSEKLSLIRQNFKNLFVIRWNCLILQENGSPWPINRWASIHRRQRTHLPNHDESRTCSGWLAKDHNTHCILGGLSQCLEEADPQKWPQRVAACHVPGKEIQWQHHGRQFWGNAPVSWQMQCIQGGRRIYPEVLTACPVSGI